MGNSVKKLRKDEVTKYYVLGDKLGTGSFAVVRKATRKSDGKLFAIKVIKKTKLNAEELAVVHDEVEIMHRINHPHAVQLYEMFETPKKIYMVMELLTGGELFDRIVQKGSYSEREASELIKCVTLAVSYLHSIGIVHRDLKPENLIYLNNDSTSPIKITDFGLAKFKSNNDKKSTMTTACGTPGYVAPEVLKNEPYGSAVDMWSIGVILYILLCGFPPFYSESTSQLYKQIKRGEYDFPAPYWSEISDQAKSLVRHLLCVDVKQRYTAKQVLAHPWIAGNVASDKKFSNEAIKRLKMLQARKRLRKGVQMIIAVNKFSDTINALAKGDATSLKTAAATNASTNSSKSQLAEHKEHPASHLQSASKPTAISQRS